MLHLKIEDSKGYYSTNVSQITVPKKENLTGFLNVGDIQLATKDGQGCQGSANV